nr:MAG: hypothetical protein [Hangzhou rhabdovirus 1]
MEIHLENRYADLRRRIQQSNCPSVIPSSTAARKEGWSDEFLLEEDSKYKWPKYAKDRGNRRTVLGRFLDFYLTGQIAVGNSVVTTVADVACLIGIGVNPVWESAEFEEQSFLAVNKSVWRGPPQAIVPGSYKPDLSGIDETKREEYERALKVYQNDDLENFKKFSYDIIMRIDPSKEATEEEVFVTNMLAFLALTLFRASVKSTAQMGNAFLKETYYKNLVTLTEAPDNFQFAPPHDRATEMCVTHLEKTKTNVSKVFIKLAGKYTALAKSAVPETQRLSWLSASVLTHTARNGLGLIQLIEQACLALETDWVRLMEKSTFSISITAWDQVAGYLIAFFGNQQTQYGYNWARIIDDGYLRGMSPKEHPAFGIMLLSILECFQGPGVWNSEWSKVKKIHHAASIKLGKKIVEKFRTSLTTITAVGDSQAVLDAARREEEGEVPAEAAIHDLDDTM